MAAVKKPSTPEEKCIAIMIPSLPEEGGGIQTDQTIDITINGDRHTILRGRRELVTPEEYQVLWNAAQAGRFEMSLA